MTLLRAGFALALIVLIGAAIFTLACSDPKRWTAVARWGMSFGLGLVGLSLWLFGAGLCGFTPSPWLGLLELVLLWLCVWRARRGRFFSWAADRLNGATPDAPSRTRWIEAVLIVFAVCVWGMVSLTSMREPLVEDDAVSIWAYKAKVLLQEPLSTSSYFTDVSKAYSHLDYPLLWPHAIAWTWSVTGQPDLQAIKLFTGAFLGAAAVGLYGLLRQRGNRLYGLCGVALLLSLPMVLSQSERLQCDAAFALFVLLSFGCAYAWLESGHLDDLRLAGLFAAGMLFTKNEGMGLFAVLTGVLIASLVGRRDWRRCRFATIWLVAVPLLLTSAWFLWRVHVPKVHEDYGSRIIPFHLPGLMTRLREVVGLSLVYFGDFHDWWFFWPFLLLVVVLTWQQWKRWPLRFLFLAIVLSLLLYGYVCAVSPWKPSDLLDMSANRLLLHLAGICVLLMLESIRQAGLMPWTPLRAGSSDGPAGGGGGVPHNT